MTKVLVIRFSSIGDIVLTTPVLRNLSRQMHGGVEIHYLTKKSFAPLLSCNPYISKVYTIEKSTNEVMEQLKEEAYHYIVDLHRNFRSARVKSALKVLAFTFRKYNFEKWLLVQFRWNRMPDVHIVDRYMETLRAFGIENDMDGLDYFLPATGLPSASDLPETHLRGYVALVTGAAHWRKKPRLQQYISICKQLSYPVILIGGKEEIDESQTIANECGSLVWNAAGRFDMHGSAWLISEARLVISPDTGMMHVAAAFRKPIVSMWTATVPAFGMYPYLNRALNEMVEPTHLTRRPCSKLGNRCKYKECKCVDEFPVEKVTEISKKYISVSGTAT